MSAQASLQAREQLNQAVNHLLQFGDEADRCYAARAAGNIGMTDSLQALLDCLYHEDVDVCIDAADALAKLRHPAAIARLIEVVEQHPEGDAKVSAANALAQLDDEQAWQALLAWATGNPADNREDFPSDWDDWWDIQLNAIRALERLGRAEAVPVLKGVLAEEPLDIESDLLRALTFCGSEGVDYVIELLQGDHARLARRAARALRYAGCDASLIALFKALRHSNEDIRQSAVEALGQRQAKQYFVDLVQLLRDPHPEVRREALKAAEGMLENLQAYHLKHLTPEKLIALLAELDVEGRVLILQALGRMLGNQSEIPDTLLTQLQRSLSSANAEEVEAAAQLLQQRPVEALETTLLQRLEDQDLSLSTRRNLINALKTLGRNHSSYLIPLNNLLQEDNAALRQVVMEVLTELARLPAEHDGIAAAELLELTLNGQQVEESDLKAQQDANDEGRIPCVMVNAEGDIDSAPKEPSEEEKMAAIMARFSDAYPTEEAQEAVQQSAPRSTLDAINQANISAALQTEVETEDTGRGEHIREMVEELPEELDEFGDIVVGHLDSGEKLKLSRKKIAPLPNYSNQVLAIRALGGVATEASVERLLDLMLESDPQITQEAINSIGLIAAEAPTLKALTKAVGPLSTMLAGGTDQIRHLAARALGRIGRKTAMPVLLEALQDSDSNVRIEAIRALSLMLPSPAPEKVLVAIKACLDDQVDGVILEAMTFLAAEEATDCVAKIAGLGLNNSALTESAARALGQLDPQGAAQLLLEPILDSEFAGQRPKALQMLTILAEVLD